MIPGVRGGLISSAFARDVLPAMPESVAVPRPIASALASWSQRVEDTLGLTSSVRAIADVAVLPLLELLGLIVERRIDDANSASFMSAPARLGQSSLSGNGVSHSIGSGDRRSSTPLLGMCAGVCAAMGARSGWWTRDAHGRAITSSSIASWWVVSR
jgi:hypothetical protein